MEGFLFTLLVCTLSGSLAVLALMMLEKPLARRYAPGTRYALWLAVLAGFLILWRPLVFRLPLIAAPERLETTAPIQRELPREEMSRRMPEAITIPAEMPVVSQTREEPAAAPWRPALRLTPMDIMLLAYLCGALGVLLYTWLSHARFLKTIRPWLQPVREGPLMDILREKKQEMGIAAPIPLYLCPRVDSPVLVGLKNPRLLLPGSLYSREELLLIYHHELIHYKRKDILVKHLSALALALHWFNPLIWLAARRANYVCEVSCDALVVGQQGLAERAQYSYTILNGLEKARQGTALSTGFTGGKNDMKNRIAAIMQRPGGKRSLLPVLMMGLMLLLSGFTLAETAPGAAPQKGFPREAYIHSPIAASAGLCEISDDYEIPAAVYYNGVKVQVMEIEKSRGGYPESLSDPTQMWGRVNIDMGEGMEISGWVPQICLQYTEDSPETPAQLPTGTLVRDEKLMRDNGLTDAVLGDYPKGTPVTLLGTMKRYHHVLVEGQLGFIPLDSLQADADSQAVVDKGQPEWNMFGDTMPGHYERYLEYQNKMTEIMGLTDDETVNPSLENMAARSQLALDFGYEYMDVINAVPGEEDMARDEAAALGESLVREKYGYQDADVQGVSVSFYYQPGAPEKRYWKVIVHAANGKGNASVEMDQQGNPLTYFQGEAFPPSKEAPPSAEEIARQQEDISYYTEHFYPSYPKEGDMDREQALTLAWQRLGEAAAEGFSRSEYLVHRMTFHHHNRDNLSWWLAAFKLKGQEPGGELFFVAVTSPEGNIISSDASYFLRNKGDAGTQQRAEGLPGEYGQRSLAYIHSPIAASAGLCEIADDYEVPAAVYYNGVRVLVLAEGESLGAYPESLSDPTEMWGQVVIETESAGMEVAGWVPLICLQYVGEDPAPPAALPVGTLAYQAELRKDTGLSEEILGTYPKGASLTLLGTMKDYHHVVAADGQAGFIPLDALQLDPRNSDIVAQGQPEQGVYSSVMPGHFERYREYEEKMAQIMGMTDGESMNPSLENLAARSQLAKEYGYEYADLIYLVPGEGDMAREEVMQLGDKLLRDKYGYTDQDIRGISLRFYHKKGDPDTRYWGVTLYAERGKGNVNVEMDNKGNPLTYHQGKPLPSSGEAPLSAEEIQEQQKHIDYYIDYYYPSYPKEGDMDREQALTLAWQRLGAAAAEGFSRSEYLVQSMTFHRHNRDNLSWWLAAFILKGQEPGGELFFVAVTSPEGNIISSDAAWYREYSLDARKLSLRNQLEEELGRPLALWTAEEKAAFDPQIYSLPGKGDISQEEALEKALDYLKTVYAVTQEDIDGWTPGYSYLKEGHWYIDFLTPESVEDITYPHYTVVLHGTDGYIVNVFDLNTNG